MRVLRPGHARYHYVVFRLFLHSCLHSLANLNNSLSAVHVRYSSYSDATSAIRTSNAASPAGSVTTGAGNKSSFNSKQDGAFLIFFESTDWVIFLSASQKHRNSNRKQRGRGDRHRRRHRSTTSSPIRPYIRPSAARSLAVHVRHFAVPDVSIRYHIAVDVRPPPGQKREQPGQGIATDMRRHGQPARGVVPAVW